MGLSRSIALFVMAAAAPCAAAAATYHVDPAGDDARDGLTPATAWASLERASRAELEAGDALLLRRGATFAGSLVVAEAAGSPDAPVRVGAYGEGELPVIDARSRFAAVELVDASHVRVADLALTSDGGAGDEPRALKRRHGVIVRVTQHGSSRGVVLEDLVIRDIFPAEGSPHEGRGETTHLGVGVTLQGSESSPVRDAVVRRCTITRTGFKGIDLQKTAGVLVEGNRLTEIGGPGIQPGNSEDLVVRGNTVLWTGCSNDPRMHGRGSGIWPWSSRRVLIERNTFGHARGKADSCGVHIDYHCSDVVVQHNLTFDNEGGFIEILGDCHNSAYRYNVSVNDGARVKRQRGAHQEGKIVWTSGYVGRNAAKHGPYDSYLYNNTVYVGPGTRSTFAIAPTTRGLLMVNNVFHLEGVTAQVFGDQDQRLEEPVQPIERAVVANNLYLRADLLPADLPIRDSAPLVGNTRPVRPGGHGIDDHAPRNVALVRDRGIVVERLPGDDVGLRVGLAVDRDILGNPIVGLPDLGAYELPVEP